MLSKEILAKAIVLSMQDTMVAIQKTVENSTDMEEIAVAYDKMAALVRQMAVHLDILEKEDA